MTLVQLSSFKPPSKSIGDDDYARDALSASHSAHDSLGAKEGMCEDRVADNAVAECDELQIIDEEYLRAARQKCVSIRQSAIFMDDGRGG